MGVNYEFDLPNLLVARNLSLRLDFSSRPPLGDKKMNYRYMGKAAFLNSDVSLSIQTLNCLVLHITLSLSIMSLIT